MKDILLIIMDYWWLWGIVSGFNIMIIFWVNYQMSIKFINMKHKTFITLCILVVILCIISLICNILGIVAGVGHIVRILTT